MLIGVFRGNGEARADSHECGARDESRGKHAFVRLGRLGFGGDDLGLGLRRRLLATEVDFQFVATIESRFSFLRGFERAAIRSEYSDG